VDGPRLAILIPAYREAKTIGPVVATARACGTVIVVDDCSPDDTGLVAAQNGAIVLRNEHNCGYDETLNRAFDEAAARGFAAAVTMDADGEHDPSLLVEFDRLLVKDRIPLVLGYRPRKQRISEIVMGAYIKARFGVEDILCGMKGYDMRLWYENGGFDHTKSIGTELALNSIRRKAPFRQVPVSGTSREDTPRFGPSLRANGRIFAALLRALRQEVQLPRPAAKPRSP
jgi:glycosyltransferase involved in cell wall biosynthesis